MKIRGIFPLILALVSPWSLGGCVVPETASGLPDGSVADKATMLAAHKRVWDYVEAADSYLDCLDRDEAAAGTAEPEASRRQRIQAYNAVVSQMVLVSEELKREVAEFNARR